MLLLQTGGSTVSGRYAITSSYPLGIFGCQKRNGEQRSPLSRLSRKSSMSATLSPSVREVRRHERYRGCVQGRGQRGSFLGPGNTGRRQSEIHSLAVDGAPSQLIVKEFEIRASGGSHDRYRPSAKPRHRTGKGKHARIRGKNSGLNGKNMLWIPDIVCNLSVLERTKHIIPAAKGHSTGVSFWKHSQK